MKHVHTPGGGQGTPSVAGLSISGSVSEQGGGPLGGIYVEADSLHADAWYTGETAPDGSYSIGGLPSDTYLVWFGDRAGLHYEGYYSSPGGLVVGPDTAAMQVVIGAASVGGISATMQLVGAWTVSIAASAATAPTGTPVTITATANHDVGLTYLNTYIVRDDGAGWYCGSGTTCYIEDTSVAPGVSTYHAEVSLPDATYTPAKSSPVTVTWTPGVVPATYHAVTPTRILDSRDGTGLYGPFASHVARTFQVTGRAATPQLPGGIPSNATAVTGNLTVTSQTNLGYLSIGPIWQDNPTSSTLNFPVGDDRANAVTVALGPGGTLSITYAAPTTSPTAHVIFDITGFFTPDDSGATYFPVVPTRLLDSRNGTGGISSAFQSHVAQTFQVTGGVVPPNATAVTGNLTVTGQTFLGYLAIGPIAQNNPSSSTLNFPVGDDRANAVTVALGVGGTLSITYAAPLAGKSAHVIFDVTGFFMPNLSGAKYMPMTPRRILDSRDGTGGIWRPLPSHFARYFPVIGHAGVAFSATAVTGNLTVTGQNYLGYLAIGPILQDNPTSSTLNFPLGDDRANAVTVALGSGGCLYVTYASPMPGTSAHAIFDVTGFFVHP